MNGDMKTPAAAAAHESLESVVPHSEGVLELHNPFALWHKSHAVTDLRMHGPEVVWYLGPDEKDPELIMPVSYTTKGEALLSVSISQYFFRKTN